jgi:hypothetical protein
MSSKKLDQRQRKKLEIVSPLHASPKTRLHAWQAFRLGLWDNLDLFRKADEDCSLRNKALKLKGPLGRGKGRDRKARIGCVKRDSKFWNGIKWKPKDRLLEEEIFSEMSKLCMSKKNGCNSNKTVMITMIMMTMKMYSAFLSQNWFLYAKQSLYAVVAEVNKSWFLFYYILTTKWRIFVKAFSMSCTGTKKALKIYSAMCTIVYVKDWNVRR